MVGEQTGKAGVLRGAGFGGGQAKTTAQLAVEKARQEQDTKKTRSRHSKMVTKF